MTSIALQNFCNAPNRLVEFCRVISRVNIWRIDEIVGDIENNGGQNIGKPLEGVYSDSTIPHSRSTLLHLFKSRLQ